MGGVGSAAPSAAAVKGSKEIVKWVGVKLGLVLNF